MLKSSQKSGSAKVGSIITSLYLQCYYITVPVGIRFVHTVKRHSRTFQALLFWFSRTTIRAYQTISLKLK